MDRKTVLTIGFFDGVHIGHRSLISSVVDYARENNCSSLVATFDRPPQMVDGLLTTMGEKLDIIKSLGVETIEIFEFTSGFSRMAPEYFFREKLAKLLRIEKIIVGYDFRFGKDRAGDDALLKKLCDEKNIKLSRFKPVKFFDEKEKKYSIVSSSLIRNLVAGSRIGLVNELLCRPYSAGGRVVRGRGDGKKLGFPTANVAVDGSKMLPGGIYYAQCIIDGSVYPAAADVGSSPTLTGKTLQGKPVCEVYIIDFNRNILGKNVTVNFLKFIRKEKKFDSIGSLKKQIGADVKLIKKFIKNN